MDCFIAIDIKNNAEIYQCIADTIPCMKGWTHCSNAMMGNIHWGGKLQRYFAFDLEKRNFTWTRDDKDGPTGLEVVIESMAQITDLLEEVNQLAEQFQNIPEYVAPQPRPEKPPVIQDSIVMITDQSGSIGSKIDVEKVKAYFNKMKMPLWGEQVKQWNQEYESEFTPAKPDDLSDYHYDAYAQVVSGAQSMQVLIDVNKKIAGLHGVNADNMRKLIALKAKELEKAKWCEAGGKALKYEMTTKIKLSGLPKEVAEKPISIDPVTMAQFKKDMQTAAKADVAAGYDKAAKQMADDLAAKNTSDAMAYLLAALKAQVSAPEKDDYGYEYYEYKPKKYQWSGGYGKTMYGYTSYDDYGYSYDY